MWNSEMMPKDPLAYQRDRCGQTFARPSSSIFMIIGKTRQQIRLSARVFADATGAAMR
jgi:hypothetical protein